MKTADDKILTCLRLLAFNCTALITRFHPCPESPFFLLCSMEDTSYCSLILPLLSPMSVCSICTFGVEFGDNLLPAAHTSPRICMTWSAEEPCYLNYSETKNSTLFSIEKDSTRQLFLQPSAWQRSATFKRKAKTRALSCLPEESSRLSVLLWVRTAF